MTYIEAGTVKQRGLIFVISVLMTVVVVEVMNRNRVKMFKCLWGNITFLNRGDTESVEKGILLRFFKIEK